MSHKKFILFFIIIFATFFESKSSNVDWSSLKYFSKNHLNFLADLNSQCNKDIDTWITSLRTEKWAKEMLDAAGKIPSGILTFNINSLGNFDECMNVNNFQASTNSKIKGKYCIAKFPIESNEKVDLMKKLYRAEESHTNDIGGMELFNVDSQGRITFNLGFCVPHTCSGSDLQILINDIFGTTGNETTPDVISVPEQLCSISDSIPWSFADWICLVFIFIFVIILLLSTSYDISTTIYSNVERHRHHRVLVSFSIWSNTSRLLKISNSPESLTCLNGLRAISILWIVLGHRYLTTILFPLINTNEVLNWSSTFGSMLVLAAPFAVDTFFFMSGLLICYGVFKQFKNSQTFNLPIFYLHRFLRLTPALAMVVFIQATLYKHTGTGPLWHLFNDALISTCQTHWWTTLLYVQNYVYPTMCLGQSWYLSVDTQLYILSPILIYPLMKKTKVGLANIAFWLLVAQITLYVICYLNEWTAASIPLSGGAETRTEKYYKVTHMRATPWIIGFATGYLLHVYSKQKIHMRKALVAVCWVLSLTIMGAVVFGMKPLQDRSHKFSHLEDTTYNAFSRTAWTVALVWVVIACTHGYGGPVNWLLSWDIWQIIGRLSYSMFLVHLSFQFWTSSLMREIPYFSNISTLHVFFGDVLVVLFLSYLITIMFESPITILEKALFQRKQSTSSREALNP